MNHQTEALEQASIRQYCKVVRTPAMAANFIPLAEQAIKEQHSHIRYLEALLAMECEERDRHAIANRIRDAQLPRMKTLEEFDFEKAPHIERSEPIVFTGDCGTGKSHLAPASAWLRVSRSGEFDSLQRRHW
jgi:DNA replication protein DnaC